MVIISRVKHIKAA